MIDTITDEKDLQPKWKNAPTAEDLRKDLQQALTDHQTQSNKIDVWVDNLTTSGTAAVNSGVGWSSIVPKMIRKHAEWRYASLSEPLHTAASLFSASPVSGEDGPIAEQDHAILAHQFENDIDKIALIDEVVRAGTDEGTTIYRVGWEHRSEMRKVEELVEVLRDGVVVGTMLDMVEREVTTVSRPTVEVVPFKSFIMDPNARGKMKDAQFCIFRFPTNISKLKAEGYENLRSINVGSMGADDFDDETTGTDQAYTSFNFSDDARKEFTAYEYWGFWDINDDQVLVPIVATFVNNVMIRLRENPFPDRALPFVVTQHLPVRGSNYGEPDGVLLEDNQKVTGALMRGMLDSLGRSANGQQGKMEGALDRVNQLKYAKGDDYTFRPGIDPSKAFISHKYPELSASSYNLLQQQASEAESMTGVMTFGEGVSGSSLGDTAAGVNGTLSAAAKRESGILRRIASGLTEVAKKVMTMSEVFLEPEAVERITGKPYVQPSPGLHTTHVRVKIRTSEEDNQSAADMAFLAQTTTDDGLRQILSSKVAELKNLPEIAALIMDYTPEPSEAELEMQALQKELLMAQIANERGKAHNNQSSGILDTAKAETEVNKAANLAADTELKKLEYVEEETGTNHERATDLLKVQAEGNIHYKAFEKELEGVDGAKK
jgi:hypothetical protein